MFKRSETKTILPGLRPIDVQQKNANKLKVKRSLILNLHLTMTLIFFFLFLPSFFFFLSFFLPLCLHASTCSLQWYCEITTNDSNPIGRLFNRFCSSTGLLAHWVDVCAHLLWYIGEWKWCVFVTVEHVWLFVSQGDNFVKPWAWTLIVSLHCWTNSKPEFQYYPSFLTIPVVIYFFGSRKANVVPVQLSLNTLKSI